MSPDPSSLAAATRLVSAGDLSQAGWSPAPSTEVKLTSTDPASGPRSIQPDSASTLAADQHGARFLAPATFLNGLPDQAKAGGVDRFLVRSMGHQDGRDSGATSKVVFPERATPRDTDHVSTWFEPSSDLWTAKLSSGATWSNVPADHSASQAELTSGGASSEPGADTIGSGKLGPHSIDDALDAYQKAQNYAVGLTLAVTLTQSTASSFKRLSQGQ